MTVLLRNGMWHRYEQGENYSYSEDDGSFIIWDEEGDEVESFYEFDVVGFTYEGFIVDDPPAEHITTAV